MTQNFYRTITKLHRWASYLLFIPVSFWIIGGAFMTAVPIEKVRAEHTRPEIMDKASVLETSVLMRIAEAGLARSAKSVVADSVAGKPLVRITDTAGQDTLYNPGDLSRFTLDREVVSEIARRGYTPTNEIADVEYLTTAARIEFRRPPPVWRVEMVDGAALYIDPGNGRILARRTDLWRAFDFFWMLHTLDFKGRDDFNNPLVVTASLLTALFLITGLILTYHRVTLAAKRRRNSKSRNQAKA